MYDELVKRLRSEADCPDNYPEDSNLMREAADAIEELTKDLERSKNYEMFWNKEAEEALRRFQVAVANKPRWIPVSEKLPEANVDVLALYEWTGQFHKEEKYTYICRASYIPKNTIRVDDKWAEVDEEWMDYWEETDSYYVPEGWYEECSQGNSDYMSYHIGATVTHWQYLPQPPKEEEE